MSIHSDFKLQFLLNNNPYILDLIQVPKSQELLSIAGISYSIKGTSEQVGIAKEILKKIIVNSFSSNEELSKKLATIQGIFAILITKQVQSIDNKVLEKKPADSDIKQVKSQHLESETKQINFEKQKKTSEASASMATPESRKQSVEEGLIQQIRAPGAAANPINIQERMKQLGVPGVSIAVINMGEVDWSNGYGELDNTCLSQTCSISKTITAMAVLSLIDLSQKAGPGPNNQLPGLSKGLTLSLDTDVSTILGADLWKSIDPKNLAAKEKVTIRRLLSHSAGTTVSGFAGYPRAEQIVKSIEQVEQQIEELIKKNSSEKGKNSGGISKELNAAVDKLQKLHSSLNLPTTDDIILGKSNSGSVTVASKPGSEVKYSGGGTMILQKVIEVLTNKSFPRVVQEQVLKNLNMENSGYFPSEKNCVHGNDTDRKPLPGRYYSYPELAPAGFWSTSKDIAKMAIGIQDSLKGGKSSVFSTKLAGEMVTGQNEKNLAVGLGVFIHQSKDGKTVYFSHSGSNEGFKCLFIANNQGQGVVVLTNSNNGMILCEEVINSVASTYGWPNKEVIPMCQQLIEPQELSSQPISPEKWSKKLVGNYVCKNDEGIVEHSISISLDAGKIKIVADKEAPFEIFPLGDNLASYRLRGPGAYELIRFNRTVNGLMNFEIFGDKFVRTV